MASVQLMEESRVRNAWRRARGWLGVGFPNQPSRLPTTPPGGVALGVTRVLIWRAERGNTDKEKQTGFERWGERNEGIAAPIKAFGDSSFYKPGFGATPQSYLLYSRSTCE